MKSLRTWVTPLATGAFLVVAGTGAAMLFHAGSSFGRVLHEWMGGAMIAAEKLTGTSSPSFLARVTRNAASFPGGP